MRKEGREETEDGLEGSERAKNERMSGETRRRREQLSAQLMGNDPQVRLLVCAILVVHMFACAFYRVKVKGARARSNPKVKDKPARLYNARAQA